MRYFHSWWIGPIIWLLTCPSCAWYTCCSCMCHLPFICITFLLCKSWIFVKHQQRYAILYLKEKFLKNVTRFMYLRIACKFIKTLKRTIQMHSLSVRSFDKTFQDSILLFLFYFNLILKQNKRYHHHLQ